MLLKNFIILLLYTLMTELHAVRGGERSLHATSTTRRHAEGLEENLKAKKVRKYLFEENSVKIENEGLCKNYTQLSDAGVYNEHERELTPNRARKRSQAEFKPTHPELTFAEEPQTFSIIEQLKLDAVHDTQEDALFNQGQLKAGKKKKKKKKKKRRKKNKKKPMGEDATVLYTQLTTKKPYYYQKWTTKKPKRVKYYVKKKHTLKKKKKEYLNHLKQVIYPFVKFIAFFTVLNPFTFKVFLFTLISPVVFGFLGFMALSLLVKPTLHLFFDVKKHVNQIKARRWREKKRRERWHKNRRPITIHKHYYKNVVLPQTPHSKPQWKPKPLPHPNWPEWVRSDQTDFRPQPQQPMRHESQRPVLKPTLTPTKFNFNPILPNIAAEIEGWSYGPTQLESFKRIIPAKVVANERLPLFRDHISRPLLISVNRHKSPQPPVAPVRASTELIEPPFL